MWAHFSCAHLIQVGSFHVSINTEYHILFDLGQDPHETINLFGQPGYEATSVELQTKLDNWLKQEQLELTFDDLGD